MKKRLLCSVLTAAVICLMLALPMTSAMAAETTYVVSFRAGANGSFSSGAVSYLSGYGTVTVSAAGNLFVEVEAGTPFPSGIVSYLSADDGYYYKSGLTGGAVEQDETYVAQYGILSGGGAVYAVRYVDAESGIEIAEPYMGFANSGDQISFAAKAVSGYAVDAAEKTLTVSEGAELVFHYTGDGTLDSIEYVYGEDTITQQTVQDATGDTAGEETENTAVTDSAEESAGEEAPAETVEDNDTPLNSGVETIPEDDVPLSGGAQNGGASQLLTIGAIICALLLTAAVTVLVVLRRKKTN